MENRLLNPGRPEGEPVLPGPDLDKLSGMLYLKDKGLPVPTIFETWEEAEQHLDSGGDVIGRGYVKGKADSSCIDVFPPPRNLEHQEDLVNLRAKCDKILLSPEFAIYAQQFRLDPQDLEADVILQEKIGPLVRKIITMDNAMGDVFIQRRQLLYGTKYGDIVTEEEVAQFRLGLDAEKVNSLSDSPLTLHLEAKKHLNSNYAYQFEMIGSGDNPDNLYLVQVRPVVRLPHEGIFVFLNRLQIENLPKFLEQRLGNHHIIYLPIDHLKNGVSPFKRYELNKEDPYILYLDSLPDFKLPIGIDYGNIKGLVIEDESPITTTFLQHNAYRLIKLVWLRGGVVIITPSSEIYGPWLLV
jgi:hypothetical protein